MSHSFDYHSTRLGLLYASFLSFHTSASTGYWDDALRVFHHIKRTPGQGLLLSADFDLQLWAYCDSYWASCPVTQRSLTDFFISLGHLQSPRSPRNNILCILLQPKPNIILWLLLDVNENGYDIFRFSQLTSTSTVLR